MTSAAARFRRGAAASGQPLEHLLARRMIEGLADLAQDVVRHRHPLGGGPDLQPTVEVGGTFRIWTIVLDMTR